MGDRPYAGKYIRGDARSARFEDRFRVTRYRDVIGTPQPQGYSMDMLVVPSARTTPKPSLQILARQEDKPPERKASPQTHTQSISEPFATTTYIQPTSHTDSKQLAAKSKNHRRAKIAPKRRSRLQLTLAGMAVLTFGIGLLVNVQTLQTNNDAKAQVAALSQKTNSSTDNSASALPNETKPSGGSVSNYQVAPNLPKYLKIPKLGTNARVKPLGITSNGALQTPNNIYDTGWYDASARPGDPGSVGAILIDGHVRGPTLSGVFNEIKQLRPGDTMQIVRGDNQVFNYKVVKVQNYDASSIDMGELLASVQPGEPGLNLITCGGSFNRSSWEYTQRTVVFAVQL